MNIRSFSCLLIAFSFVTTIARGSEWQTDYEQALASAKAAKKCVLLDFTGSDWCGPCIEMKKVVFSKAAFLNFAKMNLVLVEVDYPKVKALPENVTKQNERLLRQYGIDKSGYPTVILLNPDGKILGQLEGYSGERPADIIAWVEKLRSKSS
ncbi:MAG TPA: thioredoxin family protein [Chthoniobacterales bacterium]